MRALAVLNATVTDPVDESITMRDAAHWARGILRECIWRLPVFQIRNPPLPPRVTTILFVCLGNICRSPFAAMLAQRQLDASGRNDVRCLSAGIRAKPSSRPPAEAVKASVRYGVPLEGHTPQPLTSPLIRSSDIIVVMEAPQVRLLCSAHVTHRERILLLSLLDNRPASAYDRYHITDPFGKPLAAFEACYERIDRAIQTLLKRLPPR